MITKNEAGQWVCHCGNLARNDGTEYDWVCTQWPFCSGAVVVTEEVTER